MGTVSPAPESSRLSRSTCNSSVSPTPIKLGGNTRPSLIAGNATSTTGIAVYTGASPSLSLIEASVTATATSQPTASETGVSASDDRAAIAGGVAEDDVTAASPSGKVDLSGLTRNSYIILGLLAAVLVLLLVSIAFIVKANQANVVYRSVPTATAFGEGVVKGVVGTMFVQAVLFVLMTGIGGLICDEFLSYADRISLPHLMRSYS
ncbi:hypothetical protein GY45DRAFT_837008 [Cubamyces sp. BRFM 1775]|nr:hypothetical protein GY45DRAFT_837008 [Cubamyces sp. BRFM 1775]